MLRRLPIALALAVVMLPAAARAQDLMQTYELARSGDRELSISESSRDIARESRIQARAQLLPSISGSASIGRGYEAGRDGSSRSRSYGVGLQQTVLDLGRISSLRAQQALDEAAGYDLEAANDELITRTSAAYFDVLIAIETLAAAVAAEEALQKEFDFADRRLEVGLAPITDVHEARARYDSARANVLIARNALEDAYQALAGITGQPVRELNALPEDFQPELPTDDDVEQWVATAIERNPTLRAAELAARASEHGVAGARSQHLPRITLGADYGNNAAWGDLGAPGAPTHSGRESHSVGLSLSVPLYAGGAIRSGVREAIARRDISHDQLELTRRTLERSTRAAYQAVVAGVSEVEARRQAVLSARSAYEASQVGLEVGTRTVVDVLINQQNLFNAESDLAHARYRFLQNRLLLSQAAGILDISDLQDINRLLTVPASTPRTSP